jgi:aerobic carbon-monoxide dehydrogenase large subunit
MDGTAPAKDVWIGRAMPRREDARLLAGRGRFVDDLAPEGALWLEVVRSPFPAGRIVALDVTEAAAMPGVALVLTAGDLALCGAASVNALIPGARLHPMEVLAQGRIRAAGQAVAAVVADSPEAARDAAEAVVLEVAEGADDRDPGVVAWSVGGPVAAQGLPVAVAVDHALVAPLPLEPRAALAVPGDVLTVWLSTQTPQRCRDDLCAMLGLPRDALRVVAPDVGGAFGGKASLMPEDVLVALAALRLGRAVRWRATRSDDFLSATQGRGAQTRAEGWVDGDGRLTGLRARMDFPLGHWMPHSALAPVRNGGRILPGPYAVGQVDVAVTARLTEGPGVNIYRGAGRPEAAILMERLIDRAAQAAGIDPLEARRRNLARTPQVLPSGDRICSGDFAGLLDRLEHEAGYAALRGIRPRGGRRGGLRDRTGAVCGTLRAGLGKRVGDAAARRAHPGRHGIIGAGTGARDGGGADRGAGAGSGARGGRGDPRRHQRHARRHRRAGQPVHPVGGAAMWRACAAFLSLATDAAARHLNRAADGLHAGAI